MPKAALPPTKVQSTADALSAAPLGTTVKELNAAVKAIKKVYYAALGLPRRRALSKKLDELHAALTKLSKSPDKKVAGAALRAIPPALRPKG